LGSVKQGRTRKEAKRYIVAAAPQLGDKDKSHRLRAGESTSQCHHLTQKYVVIQSFERRINTTSNVGLWWSAREREGTGALKDKGPAHKLNTGPANGDTLEGRKHTLHVCVEKCCCQGFRLLLPKKKE